MTLSDRIRKIAEALPEAGSVTLNARDLRAWLEEEPTDRSVAEPAPDADEMLRAAQVAEILNCSLRFVYDHGRELGARRLSRRCTRYPKRRVLGYRDRRNP